MKFEESSLTGYLVKNLEHLTEADPDILAKYVATLLKKDKPTKELKKLCTENLVEFLGNDTKSFITKLFQALEDGSIVSSTETLNTIKPSEQSSGPSSTVDHVEQESLSPKVEKFSSSPVTDPEEKEVSDDDDDDRNHKHRRRETRSMSSDKDAEEPMFRRPYRKLNKIFDNGKLFQESDPQSSEIRKEYNPAPIDGVKFEKRRPGVASLPRASLDVGQRTRASQANTATRFDVSTSLGHFPLGSGRVRSNAPWNQHDSRFGSVDTLDFSSQMASQGPIPPGLFGGRGISDTTATQSGSWGAFGMIHVMPNGGLDTLHTVGLQGALRPTISPLNTGIPRQRCRDFEERGFCLRGDMCPMEHGVNRIVVEDVQSLSQFNLPVSIPSAHLLGVQGGSGPLPPGSASSSAFTNSKVSHGKISRPGVADDGLGFNGMFSVSADAAEADFYDPDQPLWNNDRPETSSALLRVPSPKLESAEPLWDADPPCHHSFRLADGNDGERSDRSITTAATSRSGTSSVWGRIGNSGNKMDVAGKSDNTASATGYLGNELKEEQDDTLSNVHSNAVEGKQTVTEEVGLKTMNFSGVTKLRQDSGCNAGRSLQKALRTLFVSGIPLKNNRRDALLSHFKKFGDVIDIYIPLNSEKAFVQFAKREEAEAALKAPDAVMGNRFIKLWWANRDSIPDDGESSGNVPSVPSRVTTALVPSHSSIERGNEIPSAAPMLTIPPVSDANVACVPPRSLVTNGPKVVPPAKTKLEALEQMQEEIRKKQEMLAQKRNDFRQKLYKLEKQAVAAKGEASFEQAVKRHKPETVTDVAKSSTPRHVNPVATDARQEPEKTLLKSTSGEHTVAFIAKTNTVLQESPRSVKQPIRLPISSGAFLANRFKLDNRPTAFRILPPLPVDVANVSLLEEHFSPFGDLAKVELEEHEASNGSPNSRSSHDYSARITFTTRHSAERAFLHGKCWQGHNLQFAWLTTSTNGGTERISGKVHHNPNGASVAEIPVEDASSSGKQIHGASSNETPVTAEGEGKGINGDHLCAQEDMIEACPDESPSREQPSET